MFFIFFAGPGTMASTSFKPSGSLPRGLEAQKENPELQFFLHEVSGLKYELSRSVRSESDAGAYTLDGLISDWLQSARGFSIQSVVTWHLNQAGFPIKPTREISTATSTTVTKSGATAWLNRCLHRTERWPEPWEDFWHRYSRARSTDFLF